MVCLCARIPLFTHLSPCSEFQDSVNSFVIALYGASRRLSLKVTLLSVGGRGNTFLLQLRREPGHRRP